MKSILFCSIIVLALSACQRPNTAIDTTNSEGPSLALVPAKDGKLYIADCLKENGFSNMASCEWNQTTQAQLGRGTKSRSCNWCNIQPYSYFVINPRNFGANWCDYFGTSSCGSYFGYTQYDFQYYRQPQQQPRCGNSCWYGYNRNSCGGSCWTSYSYY